MQHGVIARLVFVSETETENQLRNCLSNSVINVWTSSASQAFLRPLRRCAAFTFRGNCLRNNPG